MWQRGFFVNRIESEIQFIYLDINIKSFLTHFMFEISKREKQARTIRIFRRVHRFTGIFLFIFFMFISITGILLGWKKHSGGLILAETSRGSTSDLTEWLPMNELHDKAVKYLRDSVSAEISSEVDRIDVRKNRGIVKFTFKDHFWGLQLDGKTGDLLQIEVRRSDFIESIHDGSILDYYLGTSNEQIKLVYTSITGLALLTFTITGFWLWYGPKRMRRRG